MFWKTKLRVAELESTVKVLTRKVAAFEKYHNIRYCNGEHNVSHYRKVWNPPPQAWTKARV